MSVVVVLMAASAVVALTFLYLFIRSVKEGQFDDMWSPSRRMLIDDDDPAGKPDVKKEGKPTHEHD
ncbi:MAG TPA: cbb3-type cytochrome oxidase assembly protein CcoS [Kiritimatiellia bacterium]|nr:cbb3-type cytochrome oxidase assembly protein CcoS [Kiritimatiellia bacterium]